MAYDVTAAFEDIEMSLIKSMRRNMQRHIKEEYDEGLNWTQWQAEMLKGLSQYREQNKKVLKGYMGKINAEIDAAIRDAYATGESELEIEALKAIKAGYTQPRNSRSKKKSTETTGEFFKINQKKLNALVKATTGDMKKAETALLRMTDDVYRQTLFKAQMFYNTGAGSMWQCVDMATKDFLNAGINCVQYKSGARVNIASYAEMSLRTANKRANLMGQANGREKYGVHTVKVNARGIACPMCLQWLDKVYIDDVYGAGTAAESAKTGYPLLSTAVEGGLYHPNCKDSCSTYYPGVSREPQEITKDQEKETIRRYNLEQKQRYYERNYKRNMRLGNGCLDQDSSKEYFRRAGICKDKLIELCDNNSDVLRLDKARLSLRGVLSVDNAGRISIAPPAVKGVMARKELAHSDSYNNIVERIKKDPTEYIPVQPLKHTLSEEEIIQKISGGDKTGGSCSSLALSYIGNKSGYDVTDFRGGNSQYHFSQQYTIEDICNFKGVKSIISKEYNAISNTTRLLNDLEEGKEYYLGVGKHAAIVKKTPEGLKYLELQSGNPTENGWTEFTSSTLKQRFGAKQSSKIHSTKLKQTTRIIDCESLYSSNDFKDILGYLNTSASGQMKGVDGNIK